MRKMALLAFVLLSVMQIYAAGVCGDRRCDAGENCSACPSDCGICNGASCSYDNQCASSICCSGTCDSSCVAYPSGGAEPTIGWFKVAYASEGAIIIALLVIVAGGLIITLERRKK